MKKFLFILFSFSFWELSGRIWSQTGLITGEPKLSAPLYSGEILENKGQVRDELGNLRSDVLFVTVSGTLQAHLTRQGLSYQSFIQDAPRMNDTKAPGDGRHGQAESDPAFSLYRVDLKWLGNDPNFAIERGETLPGLYHFYNVPEGTDPVTHVRGFARITLKNLWPGVHFDLFQREGLIETEWRLDDGDLHQHIAFEILGAIPRAEGAYLILETPYGTLREGPLKAFQEGRELPVQWEVEKNRVRIGLGGYEPGKAVRIDPPVVGWGTYYGELSNGTACATDPTGNIYLAGYSFSQYFIATAGAHQSTFGGGAYDGFLVKFNSQGQRLWATFYGGSDSDYAYDVACDASGNVYLCGLTASTSGIATPGSHQFQLGGPPGDMDAFLVKFSPAGVRVWGTYYGGDGSDWGLSCAADAAGTVYLVGRTGSDTGIASSSGAFQLYLDGTLDAFAARFSTSGARLWGTYFGGSGNDEAYGCAVDASGHLLMCGYTEPSASPLAFGSSNMAYGGGISDGFVARFSPSGMVLWAAYCGGEEQDEAYGVTSDADNNVFVVGATMSQNSIATSGAHQPAIANPSAGSDGFIMKFTPAGALLWGTYYGGIHTDQAKGASVDSQNRLYVFGETYSDSGFATAGAFQPGHGGLLDAYVAVFNSAGGLLYGSYLGGNDIEYQVFGTVYSNGTVYAGGTTSSPNNIAAPGGHQLTLLGSTNAFLVKLCEGTPFYWDGDGDGFGNLAMVISTCDPPPGYVPDPGDCVDSDAGIYPGASETCNGVDDNCNGTTDEGVLQPFYPDLDEDGFGNAAAANNPLVACTPPSGYVANAEDCQDNDPSINPLAMDICNNIDDNCDGLVDNFFGMATTQLNSASCGVTVTDFNHVLRANHMSGALQYEFEFSDGVNTYYEVRPNRGFYFRLFPWAEFNKTYQVRVRWTNNGFWWSCWGPLCTVTTPPIPTTQLQAGDCGATGVSPSQVLRAIDMPGAIQYEFEFSDGINTYNELRPNRGFYFALFPWDMFNTVYSVRVRWTHNGATWSDWGPLCTVTTSPMPLTQLQAGDCGVTVSSPSQVLRAVTMAGALQYEFKISNGTNTWYLLRPNRGFYFGLFGMPPGFFPPGPYTVEVRWRDASNVWSPWGPPCNITLANALNAETGPPALLVVEAFPVPFSHTFLLSVETFAQEAIQIHVTDMQGRTIENRTLQTEENGTFTMGGQWPAGVYAIRIQQAGEIRTLRVVKTH